MSLIVAFMLGVLAAWLWGRAAIVLGRRLVAKKGESDFRKRFLGGMTYEELQRVGRALEDELSSRRAP